MSRTASLRGQRDVVVSGLGVVSPYGAGAKSFWSGVAAGTCAIKSVTVIETDGLRCRIAAEIPADVMSTLGVSRRRSRADRIALVAAQGALSDAGLAGRRLAAPALGGG